MSADNNNGLFSKIKRAVDVNHRSEAMGQDTEEYKKFIKEKYEAIARSIVKKREEKLLEQFKNEVSRLKTKENELTEEAKRQQKLLANTWHSQVAGLQQEIEQQKKILQASIDQAMEAGRNIGVNQAHEEFQQQYENIIKQQQVLQTQYAQEQSIKSELIRENQVQNTKILQLETELKHALVSMEEAKQKSRSEARLEMQQEFDLKLEQFKRQLDIMHKSQVQNAVLIEKQKILHEIEQQNQLAFKQKERELRDEFELKLNEINAKNQELLLQQSLQLEHKHNDDLRKALQEQQERLISDLALQNQAKHQAEIQALMRKHAEEVQLAVNKALDMHDQDVELMRMQYEREKGEALAKVEYNMRKEFQEILTQQRKKAADHFSKQRDEQIALALAEHRNKSEEDLRQDYAIKWQQHLEMVKDETQNEKLKLHKHYEQELQDYLAHQEKSLRQEYETTFNQKFEQALEQEKVKFNTSLEQELKRLNSKFAHDKAAMIKDLSDRLQQEKQVEMHKYETELREAMHKEMVRQKENIQQKFAKGQEAALLEQKRRLEAQHRHEIERIKQGYFELKESNDFSQSMLAAKAKHQHVAVERGVEQIASRILAKFQGSKERH